MKQKFASDINSSKITNGLQVTNNMGTNTTNFLSKLMFEAPKDIKEKQEAVVSGFQEPEIDHQHQISLLTKGIYYRI